METLDFIPVRVSRRYLAPAEAVFDAWLDPGLARKWLFATPAGEMVQIEIDGRVGGGYTIVERRDGQDVQHKGTYLEVERPRRLVFSLAVDREAKDLSRVTVNIRAMQGGCELGLVHEIKAEYAEFAERTEKGWHTVLGSLARVLGDA